MAYISHGRCELVSRNRNSYKSFGELRGTLARMKVRNAVLDGELVCLDAEGRSIFNELLHRKGSPVFYAFDLLYLNDRDLRQLPLVERKRRLREPIAKNTLPDVVCGKHIEGRGVDLYNEVCQRNLEGVAARRKTGTYASISGWLKIQNQTIRNRSADTNYSNHSKRSLRSGNCRPCQRNRHNAPCRVSRVHAFVSGDNSEK